MIVSNLQKEIHNAQAITADGVPGALGYYNYRPIPVIDGRRFWIDLQPEGLKLAREYASECFTRAEEPLSPWQRPTDVGIYAHAMEMTGPSAFDYGYSDAGEH